MATEIQKDGSEGKPRSLSKERTIPLRPIEGTPNDFFAKSIAGTVAVERTLTERVGEGPVFNSGKIIIRQR